MPEGIHMKFLKSRLPAVIALVVIFLMFAGAMITARFFSISSDVYWSPANIISGVYSIDDGPWTRDDINVPIDDHFRKIVFKGYLIPTGSYLREIDISVKNVWISLRTEDGKLLFTNDYRLRGSEGWNAMLGEMSPEDAQKTEAMFRETMPMAMHMHETPGYQHFTFVPRKDFSEYENEELILTAENPYNSFSSFSNCVTFVNSAGNGAYLRAARETLLPSMLILLACFIGIFIFPMISTIFGEINYRYLAFGFLCFFFSVYTFLNVQSWNLNCFINDPVLCMLIERGSVYFFFTALILYCRANMKQPVSRSIAGVAALVYIAAAVIALILHLASIKDITATMPYNHILMGIIILLLTVLLFREALADRYAMRYLVSFIPVQLALFIDVLDQFLSFRGENYFIYGFCLTLATQIIQLIFDLRRRYKEAVHYQQVQRELYEARVSIMTSQIRPHFMYNALTSIAMMCTIDPPTAQEATVTFAKYLRENMDSLKQTKPVPFERELDHLKKYLYIEKLRFQNKLNIEYDITATDFVIPLLTVQPLVENAVKHGVGMKKKGGTVKIATRETEDAYEVIISDDGVGFDTSAPKADDGRSHVGMENTRNRLKEMCGGTINIESTVGEGTVATIILPKEGQGNENTVSR